MYVPSPYVYTARTQPYTRVHGRVHGLTGPVQGRVWALYTAENVYTVPIRVYVYMFVYTAAYTARRVRGRWVYTAVDTGLDGPLRPCAVRYAVYTVVTGPVHGHFRIHD